jgi:hypothetical protein
MLGGHAGSPTRRLQHSLRLARHLLGILELLDEIAAGSDEATDTGRGSSRGPGHP